VLALYAVLTLLQPFIAGLDHRYGWSGSLGPVVYVAGYAALIAAFALLAWSMAVNRFFEATVRIQTDRGQTVTTNGPYRYVRHPGYAAVVLTFIGVGLATGSWAALVIGFLGSGLFVVRTALEDRTLQAELPGYAEFARQTASRLLPGVW
jgi:protein-S-isoprenylcysteine O-methyltransferase Ste14